MTALFARLRRFGWSDTVASRSCAERMQPARLRRAADPPVVALSQRAIA
jgi:hypothetical protein